MWGIHTGNDALFLERNVIAIDFSMGDLSDLPKTREAFKEKYQSLFPKANKYRVAASASQPYRFVCEAQIGDYVVFPSKRNREINIGIIEGEYEYAADEETVYPQRRRVKWLKHLPRTAFSQGALGEVGSALTFFSVRNFADEFLSALEDDFKPIEIAQDTDEDVAKTGEEIIESTTDFILKELYRNLVGYPLEGFVADLLNAMGYRAEVSQRGGDSGIDIKAYKDELPPRIIVQVKSQSDNIGESTIQSLRGAMREGDYGLFVTLSDYTRNAQAYLAQMPIIRGINGAELAALVVKYYDKLSDKYKKIIPLKMIYIPDKIENSVLS